MRFSDTLRISRGLTALIGSGGKTTLLYRLARELREQGSVIVCTSTRIRRPDELPVLTGAGETEVAEALRRHGLLCLGEAAEEGKLKAPALPFSRLTELADYVLVEADGAKMLPLKAHAPHEPVIPPNADQTILVVGASGFGRPISEVCHRAGRFAALAGASAGDPVTPERLAAVIRREQLADKVFVNQAQTPEALSFAAELAELLSCPVYAGSLWSGDLRMLAEDKTEVSYNLQEQKGR